jgi:DNA-binding transcriptional LysR family regulator
MGLALLPEWVVGPDVRAGRVTKLPVDPVAATGDAGIWLLCALLNPPAKLRAFATALKAFIGTGPIWPHKAPGDI